jgi:hypothetical protein
MGVRPKADADTARVLTMDEARRIASNIASKPNHAFSSEHLCNHVYAGKRDDSGFDFVRCKSGSR